MKIIVILLIFICSNFINGQVKNIVTDGWEPNITIDYGIPEPKSVFNDIVDFLISFYKKDISTGSVSRCPFYISCSFFCKEAINKHGIFGVIIFIDRYFFRENFDSFSHYKFIQTEYGVLKLDDELFLY